MKNFATTCALEAAAQVEPRCMFCGGYEGRTELLDTGDTESLDGFEVWFCCYACRDEGQPCETFHQLKVA